MVVTDRHSADTAQNKFILGNFTSVQQKCFSSSRSKCDYDILY